MRVKGCSCAPDYIFRTLGQREILKCGPAPLRSTVHARLAKRQHLKAVEVCSVLLGLLLAALPGRAQEFVFQLHPAQSRVQFTLPATLHTVHGTFQFKSGTVRFDPATGLASGVLVVDATSGNTGNKDRDGRMHQQILEDQKYPDIVFTPQRISGNFAAEGTSQLQLQGLLTLHGQEHPMILTVPVQISQNQVSADVHFLLPYLQWGLKNPSTFLLRVSQTVEVEVQVVGQLTPPSDPRGTSPRR